MEWDRLPGITRIARNLRTLADAPRNRAAFRAACVAFGWRPQEEGTLKEDEDYLAFHLPRTDRILHVTFTDGAVNLAVLPLLYWEDYDPEFFDGSDAQYLRARAAFDRKFEKSLQQAAKVLGPPLRAWTEEGEDRFRKAVWQGRTFLLALQQDDYDEQYGFDINFLLQPHEGPLPPKPELRV